MPYQNLADMKKIYIALAFMLGTPAMCLADKIPVNAARNIAKQFVADNVPSLKTTQAGRKEALVLASQTEGHYIFNIGKGEGYIVVAGDDMVKEAVLGYADAGSFSEKDLPDNLRWWLSEYDRQIGYMQQHKEQFATSSTALYADDAASEERYKEIAPLLSSTWNQDSPYNDKCPVKSGTVCPTGCVATALAQIMYYNKWPERGTGTYKGMDYGATTFDWGSMTAQYTANSSQTAKDAVATLMYAIGNAVDMEYDPSGSGATTDKTVNGLKRNFGYTKAMLILRDYMSTASWDKYIYDELSHNRPVFYTGATSHMEGHAFVCDGYRDGFLHINWGWGGTADGYYRSSALNPPIQGIGGSSGDGFNYYQCIITNMYDPNDESQRYLFSKISYSISTDKQEADANSQLKLSAQIRTKTDEAAYAYGVRVDDANGNATYIKEEGTHSGNGTHSDSGYTISLTEFPKAEGSYVVTPAVYGADSKAWRDIYASSDGVRLRLAATVKDGKIAFSRIVPANIEVSNLETPEKVYAGESMTIKARIKCKPGADFNESLYVGFLTEGEPDLHKQENGAASVLAGAETEASLEVTAPKTLGEYKVALFALEDGKYRKLTDYYNVEVIDKTPVLDVQTKIIFPDNNYNSVDPDNVRVRAYIKCTEKDFNDEVRFVVYDPNTKEQVGYMAKSATIKKGRTQNITISGKIDGTEPGHAYYGQVCCKDEDGNWTAIDSKTADGEPANYIQFTTADPAAIQGIVAGGNPSPTEIYTMDGRRIEKANERGSSGHSLYIMKKGGKWVKTTTVR